MGLAPCLMSSNPVSSHPHMQGNFQWTTIFFRNKIIKALHIPGNGTTRYSHNILSDVIRLGMYNVALEQRKESVERLIRDFRNFVVIFAAQRRRRRWTDARVGGQARQLRRSVSCTNHREGLIKLVHVDKSEEEKNIRQLTVPMWPVANLIKPLQSWITTLELYQTWKYPILRL